MLIKESSVPQFTIGEEKYTLPHKKESAEFVKKFLYCQNGRENIPNEAKVMDVPNNYSTRTPYMDEIAFNDYRFDLFSKYYKFISGKIEAADDLIKPVGSDSLHLRGHLIELFTKLYYYYNLPKDEESAEFRKSIILDSIDRISRRIFSGHYSPRGTHDSSSEQYPNKLPKEILFHLVFLTFKFAKDENFEGKDVAGAQDIGARYFTFFISDTHKDPSFDKEDKKRYDELTKVIVKGLNTSNYKIAPVRFLLGTLLSKIDTKSISEMEDSSFKLADSALEAFYDSTDELSKNEKLPDDAEEIIKDERDGSFGMEFRKLSEKLKRYREKDFYSLFIEASIELIKKYKTFAFFFTKSEIESDTKYQRVHYQEKKKTLERIKKYVVETILAYDNGKNFFDIYIQDLIEYANEEMSQEDIQDDDPRADSYRLGIIDKLTKDLVAVNPTVLNGIPLDSFSESFNENFKKIVLKKIGDMEVPIEGLPEDVQKLVDRNWEDEKDPYKDIERTVRIADSDKSSLGPTPRKYNKIEFFAKLDKVSSFMDTLIEDGMAEPTTDFFYETLEQIKLFGSESGVSESGRRIVDIAHDAIFESGGLPKDDKELENRLKKAKKLIDLSPSEDEQQVIDDEKAGDYTEDPEGDIIDTEDDLPPKAFALNEPKPKLQTIDTSTQVDEPQQPQQTQSNAVELPPPAVQMSEPNSQIDNQPIQEVPQDQQVEPDSQEQIPGDVEELPAQDMEYDPLYDGEVLGDDEIANLGIEEPNSQRSDQSVQTISQDQQSEQEDDEVYVIDDDEKPEKILELLEKNKIEYDDIPEELKPEVIELRLLRSFRREKFQITKAQNKVFQNCIKIYDYFLTIENKDMLNNNSKKIIISELDKDIPFNNKESIKKLLSIALSLQEVDDDKKIFDVFGSESDSDEDENEKVDKTNGPIEELSADFLYSTFIEGKLIPNRTTTYLKNKNRDDLKVKEWEKNGKIGPAPVAKQIKENIYDFHQDIVDEYIDKFKKIFFMNLYITTVDELAKRGKKVLIEKLQKIHDDSLIKRQIHLLFDEMIYHSNYSDLVDEDSKSFIWKKLEDKFLGLKDFVQSKIPEEFMNPIISKLKRSYTGGDQNKQNVKILSKEELMDYLDDYRGSNKLRQSDYDDLMIQINKRKIPHIEALNNELFSIRQNYQNELVKGKKKKTESKESLLTFLKNYRKNNNVFESDYDYLVNLIEGELLTSKKSLEDEILRIEKYYKEHDDFNLDGFLEYSEFKSTSAVSGTEQNKSSLDLISIYNNKILNTIERYKNKDERKKKLEELKKKYEEKIKIAKEREEKIKPLDDEESIYEEEEEIEDVKKEFNLNDDDILVLKRISELGGLYTFELMYETGIPGWAKKEESLRKNKFERKKGEKTLQKLKIEDVRKSIKLILSDDYLVNFCKERISTGRTYDAVEIVKFDTVDEMKQKIDKDKSEILSRKEKFKDEIESMEAERNMDLSNVVPKSTLDKKRAIKPNRSSTRKEFGEESYTRDDTSNPESREKVSISSYRQDSNDLSDFDYDDDNDDPLNESKMKILFKVKNNTKDDTRALESALSEFLPYAQNYLGFTKPVTIILDHPKDSSNLFAPTGQYDPSSSSVTIFIKNRHPKDILRSLAHELVHHLQNCKGMFNSHLMGDGAVEGYAQKNGYLRSLEKEANATMMLRDFEDRDKKPLNENSKWALKWKEFLLKERKKYVRR